MFFLFPGFAGGDPKPQQVRVLPIQQLREMGVEGIGGSGPARWPTVGAPTGEGNAGKKWPGRKRNGPPGKSWRRGYRSKARKAKSEEKGEGQVARDAQQKKGEEGEFKLWADGPNFDTEMRQDVVALEGKNAYLTCRVIDRGNKTVSALSRPTKKLP